ncbi:MFS transporter [Vulgatibacter sp.]|uniref:MFS transporter n=1 Tax=Vulgatibacter sp. TaxID=1971226 RepID=UPI003566E49C
MQQALSPRLVLLMAVAAGVTVANNYFCQPLLAEMGRDLTVDEAQLGLVPTLTQVGYALGLLLIVPMGDMLERRRTIVVACAAVSGALLLVATAGSIGVLLAGSLLLGLCTVAPQLIVPMAASLAAPLERGRVMGVIMSGLLAGILLSRTASGFLGTWFGWRAVYWLAAGWMLLLTALLRFALPRQPPAAAITYPALMRSVAGLAQELPTLRLHALLGGLGFASFSAFWAPLVLHLETLPGGYGAREAGLLGIAGVAGVLVAPVVGRWSDARGGDRRINAASLALMAAAWGLMWITGASLVGLAVGVVLLDLGVQASHLNNQTIVFALRPEARSRINTVYMVSYFVGGALGAYLGTLAFQAYGWGATCALGAAAAAAGAVVAVAVRKASAP